MLDVKIEDNYVNVGTGFTSKDMATIKLDFC